MKNEGGEERGQMRKNREMWWKRKEMEKGGQGGEEGRMS